MFEIAFARTACGTRSVHNAIAIMFAACMTCLTINDSNAASTSGREFGIARLDPFESVAIADTGSTSFASHFEYAEASFRRGVVGGLIYRGPVLPIERVSVTRQQDIVAAGPAIIGTASTYNPNEPGDPGSGNNETASGEHYDSRDWTAAIRTDLRARFGGVRYGKNYVPTYALVQTSTRQAIVRINDVGPLKPGRVIDLNEQAMRYFDPSLQRGLIGEVKITPLAGQQWALGPVLDDSPVSVASFDK